MIYFLFGPFKQEHCLLTENWGNFVENCNKIKEHLMGFSRLEIQRSSPDDVICRVVPTAGIM